MDLARFGFAAILESAALAIAFQAGLWVTGWAWCRRLNFVVASTLLPPTASAITSMISGDISLSLGMVGALSIVRFRNPVRSSVELVIYFSLITIGIGSSVESDIAVGLVIFSLILFLTLRLLMSSGVFTVITRGWAWTEDAPSPKTVRVRGEFDLKDLSEFQLLHATSVGEEGSSVEAEFRVRDQRDAEVLLNRLRSLGQSVGWTINLYD